MDRWVDGEGSAGRDGDKCGKQAHLVIEVVERVVVKHVSDLCSSVPYDFGQCSYGLYGYGLYSHGL